MSHQQAILWISALPWIVGLVVVLVAWYCDWSTRWFIDPVRGNDRNHGHSHRKPLRTHAECMRRVGHPITFNIRIHLLHESGSENSGDTPDGFYCPQQRAIEKQRSRAEDEEQLSSGALSQQQLASKNGYFSFPPDRVEIDYAAACRYDPQQRVREKQESRDQDERDLEKGKVTRAELRSRNAFLTPKGGKIDFSGSGPGSLW